MIDGKGQFKKNRPRYVLAILAVAAAAYTVDRWFISGVIASKWIGLPQYASAMKELQNASRNWGIAALVLEAAALALALPRWPKKKTPLARGSVLTLGIAQNRWTEYLGRCIFHAVLCLLGLVGLAVLIPLVANFVGALIRR
jgi:hypothetical protein